MQELTMEDRDRYLFKNVVITPHYTPCVNHIVPSFVGGISLPFKYTQHFQYSNVNPSSIEIPMPKFRKIFNEKCIYGGYLLTVYGHFIRESLSRLYFIKKYNLNYPVIFSYAQSKKLLQYQKDIFELFGINNIYIVDEVTMFNNIYFPPPGSILNSTFTFEQKEALGIIKDKMVKGKYLYISRKNFKGRTLRNEGELESILKSRGWKIIYPELLPINEQLKEYSTSEIIMGVCGSAFYSMLFLNNPSQRFIILPRYHGNEYEIIADVIGKNYYLVNIEKEEVYGDSPTNQSYTINLNTLSSILTRTNNFVDIENESMVTPSPHPKTDHWKLPESLFSLKEKPNSTVGFFWLINYSLNTGKKVERGKKALFILINKNLMQNFMVIRCYEFITKYAPEFLFIFFSYYRRLKIDLNNRYYLRLHNEIKDRIKLPITSFSQVFFANKKCNFFFLEAHLSNIGWIGDSPAGSVIGDPAGVQRIEAIRIYPGLNCASIYYGIKSKEDIWDIGSNGEVSGTTGKKKAIYGLVIDFKPLGSLFKLLYRVKLVNGEWLPWVENATKLEFSTGISAIQTRVIKI